MSKTINPEIDAADICERLVGITPIYLQNFVQRGSYGLRASVQQGKRREKRRLFSREDVFGIALVWLLFESGTTWHTDFSVDGRRFRQSLDTSDWREAQATEKRLIAQASEGKLTPKSHEFSRLGFSDAADGHLKDRLPRLAERSIQTERE